MLRVLADSPWANHIVLFNGTNTDPESKAIYQEWLARHAGSDRVTGSKTADMRSALVDYFRDQGKIMIATEAGAEGINLQFCALVVNYDLPMYPDRTPDFETYLHRIGRTGRFGRTGVALSLVSGRRDWASLESIGRHFGVQPMKLDTNDWDEVEKLVKKVMKNDNHPVATKPAAEEDMPEWEQGQ